MLLYYLGSIPKDILDNNDPKQERKEGVVALTVQVETGYQAWHLCPNVSNL